MQALSIDSNATPDWSRELRARLERHPRDTWRSGPTPAVEFWLEVHDGFRRESDALGSAADAYRLGKLAARELAALAAPRLRGLVARLHGHHEVEDFHYFPAFRGLEPRLAEAFDSLANDHARLQRRVDASLAALRELLSAADPVGGGGDARRHAAERYIRETDDLCRALGGHLRDEEDLIIPLLLERERTRPGAYFSG
jgi:hypothetical protein